MSLKQTLQKLLFVVAFAAFWLFPSSPTHAAAKDWSVVSDYSVRDDGSMKARHTFEVQNSSAAATPKALTLSVFGTEVRAVTAQAQDNTRIEASFDAQSKSINLELPDFSGANRQWSFTVNYESDAIINLGETDLLQIEPLTVQGTEIGSQKLSVAIDLELGFAVQQGTKAISSRVGIGSQILSYKSNNGLFDKGLSYYFGEQSLVTANLNANLKNESFWWQTKQFVLPPDTNQQRAVLKSISPKPSRVSLDADGNTIAEYSLSPKREISVTATVEIGLNNLTYNLDSKATTEQVSEILRERYTKLNDSWKSGQIEVDISENAPVVQIIQQFAEAVASTVEPELEASEFNSSMRDGSLGVSDTLVGELRSRGIPARIVVGRILSDGARLYELPQNHAWVEAYVPESGWITVDPVQMARSDSFGTADVLHVSFALWGVSDDQPPIDLSKWEYTYSDGAIDENARPSVPMVSVTKTMLLPGISLRDMQLKMPEGRIIDDVVLKGPNDSIYEYGSLAPLQSASIKTIQFGGSAFSTESFQAGVAGIEGFINLGGVVNSKLNAVPMILAIIATVGVSGLYIQMRHKRKVRENKSKSKNTFIMHEEKNGRSIESEDLLPKLDDTVHDDEPIAPPQAPVAPETIQESTQHAAPEANQSASQALTVPAVDTEPLPPVAPVTVKFKKVAQVEHTKETKAARSRVIARTTNSDTMSSSVPRTRPTGRKRMIQG